MPFEEPQTTKDKTIQYLQTKIFKTKMFSFKNDINLNFEKIFR